MTGAEIQLRSMGMSGARWPTMGGGKGPHDHEVRKQAMRARARAAEVAYRDRQAWDLGRSARPVRNRRYRQAVQGAVAAAAMGAVLLLFLLPTLLPR